MKTLFRIITIVMILALISGASYGSYLLTDQEQATYLTAEQANGLIAAALAEAQGPQGDQGPQGEKGPQGDQGLSQLVLTGLERLLVGNKGVNFAIINKVNFNREPFVGDKFITSFLGASNGALAGRSWIGAAVILQVDATTVTLSFNTDFLVETTGSSVSSVSSYILPADSFDGIIIPVLSGQKIEITVDYTPAGLAAYAADLSIQNGFEISVEEVLMYGVNLPYFSVTAAPTETQTQYFSLNVNKAVIDVADNYVYWTGYNGNYSQQGAPISLADGLIGYFPYPRISDSIIITNCMSVPGSGFPDINNNYEKIVTVKIYS